MDEPGQHAMNVESYVCLTKICVFNEETDYYVYIKRIHGIKTDTANLSKVLGNLGGKYKYTLIDIDPDGKKCVRASSE
ncbi:Uncharacterised protein [Salmonella enterica subsp. enterica]|nr:Uncharacterised protein [Salmonella enterica subsp. enterica]